MSINKNLVGLSMIIMLLIIVVSFLVISFGYFNTKEISLLTSRCNEIGGKAILEIHNNFTSSYSFECKE
ncbi:hypothetical protein [Aquibacillus kalidii]|uniref:hypothetical protein n=1 Tax=Aquibacillus kalidii TaxID=2762597 RepID=UPI001644EFEA|nr:hypothetical protein [Aquibacillus kalidii]